MLFAQSSAVYFNYSLQYAIQDLAGLGYQGIEIWGGRPHMYRNDLDGQIDGIIELLDKQKMQVCNFIPAQFRYPSVLCSENEHVRQTSVAYIKSAMINAVKVNSPSVSLCPGMTLFDQDKTTGEKQLFKSLKEIAGINEDFGLKLLIEPAHKFETNLILTVDDCLGMLDSLQEDDFGILLDSGHANVNGEDFTEIIPKCKNLPFHLHIDDNNGDFDAHLIPGEGRVDFVSFASALEDIGYSGFLSAELGTAYIMDPTAACKKTLDFLQDMFGDTN